VNGWRVDLMEDNFRILPLRKQADAETKEIVLSDFSPNKGSVPELFNCKLSAQEHWDYQISKLMNEEFINKTALSPDLLEKYIVTLARRFSCQHYSQQPTMVPLIIFPQNLLSVGIKMKLLNGQVGYIPDMLLPTPIDPARFCSRIGEPASYPYLLLGPEIQKSHGFTSKINPLLLYSINWKREITLDEGLMLEYFYGTKIKSLFKGSIYFSENREKYWPLLDFKPELGIYELRLSNVREHENDALAPICHKRIY
jgi:hypothetical protein